MNDHNIKRLLGALADIQSLETAAVAFFGDIYCTTSAGDIAEVIEDEMGLMPPMPPFPFEEHEDFAQQVEALFNGITARDQVEATFDNLKRISEEIAVRLRELSAPEEVSE